MDHKVPDNPTTYGITAAADLVGSAAQNLRLYEQRGLVTPHRTAGGTRRYSTGDLVVLRRIGVLLQEGLNLAGVARVLDLERANAVLRDQLTRARRHRPGSV